MTRRALGVGSGLIAVSLLAWAVVVHQTRGMEMGPSSDLNGFTWYLGLWVAMTAAMMLPSAAPVVLLVDRLSPRATPPFLVGYVVAWTVYGAVAYLVTRTAHDAGLSTARATGPLIAAAGLYGLTPLKRTCLRRCRNPLGFLMRHERHGPHAAPAPTSKRPVPAAENELYRFHSPGKPYAHTGDGNNDGLSREVHDCNKGCIDGIAE